MGFEFATFAAITVLAYLVGMAVKASSLNSKWIPVIVGAFGLIVGVAAFYIGTPEFPANDPITAAAVGVASGLAATGINQAVKQLSSKE